MPPAYLVGTANAWTFHDPKAPPPSPRSTETPHRPRSRRYSPGVTIQQPERSGSPGNGLEFEENAMKTLRTHARDIQGAATEYFLGWLVGIPVPILILIYLVRGH